MALFSKINEFLEKSRKRGGGEFRCKYLGNNNFFGVVISDLEKGVKDRLKILQKIIYFWKDSFSF